MTDLKLPEPLTVNKNIVRGLNELEKKGETIFTFAGERNIETMFELFLIKKYKSKCVAVSRKIGDRNKPIGVTVNLKMKYTKAEEEEMKEDFKHISKKLVECIKNGENTIIIPLSYIKGITSHANVLIYRKNLRQLEHFEPHGGTFIGDRTGDEKFQVLATKIMRMLTNILNFELTKNGLLPVNYVEASHVCPYIAGMQLLEGRSKLKKSKNEPGGYCSVWSMFFSELCFKNPEISSSEIIDNIYNYLTTKPSAEDYLKKVIRGYAGYIFETVNKYLEIFFKPKLTIVDVLDFTKKLDIRRISVLDQAINILVMVETTVLLDPNFNLEKELKEAKKIYKDKTKGMTKEQARLLRNVDKELAAAYYKKRILQNYEEYTNYGKITETILDSPLEIKPEEIVNTNIIKKGPYERPRLVVDPQTKKEKAQKFKEFQAIQLKKMMEFKPSENVARGLLFQKHKQSDMEFINKTRKKSVKVKKTSPNSKTKRKQIKE